MQTPFFFSFMIFEWGQKLHHLAWWLSRDEDALEAMLFEGEINSQIIEWVEDYKYLGTIIHNKLSFKRNTEQIHSKRQQWLFFLQKCRQFNVHPSILQAFNKFFIATILSFNIEGGFGALGNTSQNPMNEIIKISRKVIEESHEPFSDISKKKMSEEKGNK